MNKTAENFIYYQKAGYPFFCVETQEQTRCLDMLKTAAMDNGYPVYTWDVATEEEEMSLPQDPNNVLDKIKEAPDGSIFFMKNYTWFMSQDNKPVPFIVQWLQNNYLEFCTRGRRKSLVIVSDEPFSKIPSAIRKDFIDLKFDLPDEEEIKAILGRIMGIASGNPKFNIDEHGPAVQERLIDAALGMSAQSIENAFAYCLVKHKALLPKEIDRIKAQEIENVAGVKYVEYDSTFDQLKGYDTMKFFVTKTIAHPNSKGIILLGPAGVGKSFFAQCLSNETGLRMLTVEMAEWQGGIVGDNERLVRDGIKAIRAMAGTKGVIVFVDELEKGMSGVGGQQSATSDTINTRSMGQWLKFMQNPGCKVYFIATCNNINSIPPEYIRAERWDTAPFFVDLPNVDERDTILKYYKALYKVAGLLTAKQTEGWSGAEIKAVCRIANMMQIKLEEAVDFVVPVSKTAGEQISSLRKWAVGRTIPATKQIKIGKERSIQM